jgi:hypothetical protein
MRRFTGSWARRRSLSLFPLDDASRRNVLSIAVSCCTIAVLLAPLAGRSSFELAAEQAAFDQRFKTPPPLPTKNVRGALRITRDPFAAEHTAIPSSASVAGTRVTQGQSTGMSIPALPSVTAIISGPSPRALLEQDGKIRIVAIGDRISGVEIVAITAAGVRLRGGALLSIAEDGL